MFIVFEIKSIPTVGYSFPVKLSNINRFITDVFPVDWSPKNTTLNFWIGP